MNIFRFLKISESNKRKNVVLLVKTRVGNDIVDKKVVVKESDIKTTCEAACTGHGVTEVWVFQKIFHHTNEQNPEHTEPDHSSDLAVLAIDAISTFIKK